MNKLATLLIVFGILDAAAVRLSADESAPAAQPAASAPNADSTKKADAAPTAPAPNAAVPTAAAPSTAAAAPPAVPPLAVGYRPYRVRVSVAFLPDPALTRQFEDHVKQQMADRFMQTFGLACVLDREEVETSAWLTPPDFDNLARLTEPEVRGRLGAEEIDKQFLLVIRPSGPKFELACREWDATLRTLGPISRDIAWERRDVGDTAVALLSREFRPLYMIEDVDPQGKIARVKIRAGGLPMGSPEQALVKKGDILQPCYRYLDRNRALQRIQTVPWTFLVVDGVDGPAATCSVISGMRGGLGSNQRRRVEAVAVRVQPKYANTRVSMVLFAKRSVPLAGHQVWLTRKSPMNMAAPAETTQAVTDRDGALVLARDENLPFLWLSVRSGETMLARVPVVPGLTPDAVLELPDDSLRLGVERDLDLLKGRLVAAVAQRATITTRALALARAGDSANARKVLAETEQLPKIAEFESQLAAIRIPAVEAAQKKKDRVSESRIGRLCAQASELIRNYLAEDKLRTVQEEVKQLSEADAPDESKKQNDGSRKQGSAKK